MAKCIKRFAPLFSDSRDTIWPELYTFIKVHRMAHGNIRSRVLMVCLCADQSAHEHQGIERELKIECIVGNKICIHLLVNICAMRAVRAMCLIV